ncbi:MAG: hypothetical protein KDK99_12115 [Verrucomicrobiales bacterium]|nr:hypothetical protein [Verrucomicrobiales bacterium]
MSNLEDAPKDTGFSAEARWFVEEATTAIKRGARLVAAQNKVLGMPLIVLGEERERGGRRPERR